MASFILLFFDNIDLFFSDNVISLYIIKDMQLRNVNMRLIMK